MRCLHKRKVVTTAAKCHPHSHLRSRRGRAPLRATGAQGLDLFVCASLSAIVAVVGAEGLIGMRRVCLVRASMVGWRGHKALVAACPRLETLVDLSHYFWRERWMTGGCV